MRRKPSFFRRSLGVAVVLGLTSVGSKAHASCERAKRNREAKALLKKSGLLVEEDDI